MARPIAFFSHSSADKRPLGKLKELFVTKTGGSIDVFLSTDGQSMPFGRNWVHQLEEALKKAKLMFVFVTPQSLRSNWLHFESGYAYSKGIQVIPVGIGVDLTSVGGPLNLLQGFNVTSEAGLNNLIAVVNGTFGHSHPECFSSGDFSLISAEDEFSVSSILGPHTAAISEITITMDKRELEQVAPTHALEMMTAYLDEQEVEYRADRNSARTQGMTIEAIEGRGRTLLVFTFDPEVFDVVIPLIDTVINQISTSGMRGISILFEFVGGILGIEKHHSLTGKLFRSGVRLSDVHQLSFMSLGFRVGHFYISSSVGRAATSLEIKSLAHSLQLNEVRVLMDLLFERGVLYYNHDYEA